MATNGNGQFREDELVSRKVKVGQEWQTRIFPIIGGRLRILHESNDNLSIQTDIVRLEPDFVVVKAAIESQRGKFNGTGTASGQRDARLADSLVELAETRAIARALRFGGIGVEYTSAEEISHTTATESHNEQTTSKALQSVFPEGNGNGKPEAKASSGTADAPAQGNGDTPQRCGNGRVTQAQVRALFALSKRANYHDDDIAQMLAPFQVSRFEDLPREAASKLIGALQTEAAA
ncbi:hypothetical protein [Desulfomonile tiedjei]|uniref:Uncharacterized protein n=1 Tax=Desulfomonile tiedjei (strain ATCC 49306 / DSM 6799 / DCB-1) TaxID=706587 RepID=I4C950_DESTA|nr:hypothetical protein [Desulfomonile tiedjei]AFM26091.1 hypothetical protein Desti_3439 [Desulfomonile tiedjei DSM 6799]